MTKLIKLIKNDPKWSKITQNDQKCKIAKYDQSVHNRLILRPPSLRFKIDFLYYFYRSDIQYSIDDDTESLHKDADPESRTPIIKPSSRQLSNNSDLKGSENSLLNMTDEDLWLRKGMDEDGSFRQVYIKEWKPKIPLKNPNFFLFRFLKSHACFFQLKKQL